MQNKTEYISEGLAHFILKILKILPDIWNTVNNVIMRANNELTVFSVRTLRSTE